MRRAVLALAFLLLSARVSAQTLTGTALDIDSGLGRLTFSAGTLTIDTFDDVGAAVGRLTFGGDELRIATVRDFPKLRLSSPLGGAGSVSFNWTRSDGVDEEVLQLMGTIQPGLGGKFVFFARVPYVNGDAAMQPIGTLEFGPDGKPKAWFGGLAGEAPPPPPPPPPPPATVLVPEALASVVNLQGGVGDVQAIGDGRFLRAADSGKDTRLEVDLSPASAGTLRIEVRRVSSGPIAPYLYVYVDGVRVAHEQVASARVFECPIPAGLHRVTVAAAAQDGTLEVGGIAVVH